MLNKYLTDLFSGIQLLLSLLTGIAFVKNALMTLLVILYHSVTIHLNHKCKSHFQHYEILKNSYL